MKPRLHFGRRGYLAAYYRMRIHTFFAATFAATTPLAAQAQTSSTTNALPRSDTTSNLSFKGLRAGEVQRAGELGTDFTQPGGRRPAERGLRSTSFNYFSSRRSARSCSRNLLGTPRERRSRAQRGPQSAADHVKQGPSCVQEANGKQLARIASADVAAAESPDLGR